MRRLALLGQLLVLPIWAALSGCGGDAPPKAAPPTAREVFEKKVVEPAREALRLCRESVIESRRSLIRLDALQGETEIVMKVRAHLAQYEEMVKTLETEVARLEADRDRLYPEKAAKSSP